MADNTLYARITVGDSKVCPTCIQLESVEPNTIEWWEASGLMPRVAVTECDNKCRCGLVPTDIDSIQEEVERLIEKAVNEGFGNTVIDLTTGRTINLKDFEQIQGIITVQYERIAYMENLIYKWKIANGGKKLPDEFFEPHDIEKQILWLEKEL